MKITSWNINGYRASLKKGFRTWFESNQADIVGLQEIKVKTEQLTVEQMTYPGYEVFWNPAERPGYSGTALFVRSELMSSGRVTLGMGDPKFDIEGRVIQLSNPQFEFFAIYFPNGGRGQDRIDYKLEFYAYLLTKCQQLMQEGKNVIITGDFNTAHTEIDLANPKENSKTSGFLPEERKWVQKFLDAGFVDSYRALYPEKIQYTYWDQVTRARERNVGWRIDYYLVNESFHKMVKDVQIDDQIMGSDHCPIHLIV
ncbi:MAG TPA: exodeoxyribonuclease III [Anaerolineales bacterium]|nr:exodeoxyribonuclease III [Anaerolineales bacterium]